MADQDKDKKPEDSSSEGSTGSASTGGPRHVDPTRALRLAVPPQPTERELRDREACIDRTHKKPVLKEGSHPRGLPTPAEADVPPTTPKPPQ
jgi:hypothetical protein